MVRGLEVFGKHFADFTDRYVLIGGTASALAMREMGNEFRATKDLDIVLCVELLDKSFVEKIWEFVREGNYKIQQKSSGRKLLYRFNKPQNTEFPEMLELFSKVPDALQVKDGSHLTPIPVEDEISSLSAILLDDAYYNLIKSHHAVVEGICIASPECLIPLKAKAYFDLIERRKAGEHAVSKHIKKHMNDIFRLYTILNPKVETNIGTTVRSDLTRIFKLLRHEKIQLQNLGINGMTLSEILDELESFYAVGSQSPSSS